MPDPPETERREVVEELHGEELPDPYRWLEADTDEVRSWVERQNEYADRFLDNDAREALRPRMEARAEVPEYGVITARERGYFQRVEREEDDRAKLLVREEFDAEPRVLADPNEWEEGESMDWFYPSPDGSLVAYGVAEGGQEHYDVTVLDVATGDPVEVVRDCGRTTPNGMAWTDSGFYYATTGTADEGSQLDKEIRYHELADEVGSSESADSEPAKPRTIDDPAESKAADDPVLTDEIGEHVMPQLEMGDGTLVVAYHEGWQHSDVFRWELAGADAETSEPRNGELVRLVADAEASFLPRVSDGTVYLLTDYDAPHSRVLTCDADATEADPDELREVVPESEGTLKDLVLAGDSLVVHRQRDAHSSLAVHDRDGDHRHDVDLPGYSAIAREDLAGHPDAPEFFVRAQSFVRPPWVSRGDAETGDLETLNRREPETDAEIVVDQEFFESTDGTEVPAFVVHHEGVELDGDNPTVLYGYGGFRINLTPSYDRFRMPFLEDGGVYVHANLRGGAEYGEEWHQAGRRENKQNVFDDFYDVAEGLIDRGYTRPERLAAMGRSNGGLLVGAAITQRPDLFGAASCGVPLLDMLRFHEFLLGESWTIEYGHPDESEAFEYLREYSPYHNVESREYPAVLFETAAGDTRVHPSHARKMTARMQANNEGDDPVLLCSETGTGHGVGKPTSMEVAEQLDRWGFLYDQLGVLD
jgi:prolyl oligopeptidase